MRPLPLLTLLVACLPSVQVASGSTLFGGALPRTGECSSCPPGYGVLEPCDRASGIDTLCEECGLGLYSDRFTQVLPCTLCHVCPENFYERNPCTGMQDAVCLPCPKIPKAGEPGADVDAAAADDGDLDLDGGYGNEDYLRKCEKRTTTTTTTTTTVAPSPSPPAPWVPPTPPLGHIPDRESTPTPTPTTTTTTTAPTTTTTTATTTTLPAAPPVDGEIDKDNAPLDISQTAIPESATVSHQVNDSDLGQVGEINVTAASFQWPILLAAVLAALVFFTVGALIAVCVIKSKKKNHGKYKVPREYDHDDDENPDVNENNDAKRPLPTDELATEDEITPMFYVPPTKATSGKKKKAKPGMSRNKAPPPPPSPSPVATRDVTPLGQPPAPYAGPTPEGRPHPDSSGSDSPPSFLTPQDRHQGYPPGDAYPLPGSGLGYNQPDLVAPMTMTPLMASSTPPPSEQNRRSRPTPAKRSTRSRPSGDIPVDRDPEIGGRYPGFPVRQEEAPIPMKRAPDNGAPLPVANDDSGFETPLTSPDKVDLDGDVSARDPDQSMGENPFSSPERDHSFTAPTDVTSLPGPSAEGDAPAEQPPVAIPKRKKSKERKPRKSSSKKRQKPAPEEIANVPDVNTDDNKSPDEALVWPPSGTPPPEVDSAPANGASPKPSPVVPKGRREKPPRSPTKGSRRRHPFNRNLKYIDEDSDDEVVQQVGRPPSIEYKETASRRPQSWLAEQLSNWSEKLRRKIRGGSNGSQGVSRSASMRSNQSADGDMPESADVSFYPNSSLDTTMMSHPLDASRGTTGFPDTSV